MLLLLLLAGSAVSATGQTVDELIERNLKARGGYEKLKAIQTVKTTGTLELSGLNVEMPFTMFNSRPNKVRMDTEFQGQKSIQATDGEAAWMINPFAGAFEATAMDAETANAFKENADVDGPLVDYKKKGHKIELLGKEDVEGTEAYKLKLTRENGNTDLIYLDAEYYLEIMTVSKRTLAGQEIEQTVKLSDYKEVDGLMMPHQFEISGMQAVTMTIDSVAFNSEIDPQMFAMPKKN